MLFEDYKNLMVSFKGVLKNYPEHEESLKVHFALITMKIQDFEVLKLAMMAHLSKSDWFPSHIDLIKNSIKKLPDISCSGVLDEIDPYHKRIKALLNSKFALSLPHVGGPAYRERLIPQTASWIKQIGRAVEQLEKEYYELSFDSEDIFTEDVNKFLRLEDGG